MDPESGAPRSTEIDPPLAMRTCCTKEGVVNAPRNYSPRSADIDVNVCSLASARAIGRAVWDDSTFPISAVLIRTMA